MIHILKSSDIKRKICCLLLVFENDVLLLEAILYNPIADQIYISDGSRSKSQTNNTEDAVTFE